MNYRVNVSDRVWWITALSSMTQLYFRLKKFQVRGVEMRSGFLSDLKGWVRYCVLSLACLFCAANVFADERALRLLPPKAEAISKQFALLIGNNAYAGKAALVNPRNDAEDLGKTLKGMGFNVRQALDATRDGMNQAMRAFQSDLQANPGAVALFYYAGHGMEIEGTNYLIPVGKEFDGPEAVKEDAISAQSLLSRMQAGRARVSIVVLDACRDNPWGARGTRSVAGNGGLAVMQAPAGFLIAFAAQPGKTASDGKNGRNGLFTSKLIEEIKKPQAIYEVFNKVRDEVHKESAGAQLPEEKNVLTGETIYLAGKPAAPTVGGLKPEQMALLGKAIQGDAEALKEVRAIPALAKLLQMTSSGNTDLQTAAFLVQQQSSKNPDRRALAIATETYMRERLQTIDELKKLDEQGNPFAVLMLESLYRRGRTFAPKNNQLAHPFAQQAKEAGTLPRLTALANGGDAIAMYWLGFIYKYSGLNELFSAERSVEWSEKALKTGYLPAYKQQSEAYLFGLGNKQAFKDEAKGLQILLDGATAGSPECMIELAAIYKTLRIGSIIPRDEQKSFYWAEKAATTANIPALEVLGYMHEWGIGTEKNLTKAYEYYKKAADFNLPAGLHNIARAYEFGRAGISKNEKEAAKIYQQLVEIGFRDAYAKLGNMYQNGLGGLPKDLLKAADLFKQGVKYGDSLSYFRLGLLYEQGLGVEKKPEEALRLIRTSAEKGSSSGQYHMGRLYENGLLGLPRDIQEAKKWYTSASRFEVSAANALKRLQ